MPSNVTNMPRLRYGACGRSSPVEPGSSDRISSTALVARGDEVIVVDDLSTGQAREPQRGRDVRRARHPRRARPRRAPTSSSTSPRRPTCRPRSRGPTTTPTSTSSARCRCSRRRGAPARRSSSRRPAARSTASATAPRPRTRRCEPLSPYGIAKLCAEQYLAGWNRIHGTRPRRAPASATSSGRGIAAVFMALGAAVGDIENVLLGVMLLRLGLVMAVVAGVVGVIRVVALRTLASGAAVIHVEMCAR